MGIGDKIKGAFSKIKGKLLAFLIMWIIITSMGVTTFSIALKNADVDGMFDWEKFFWAIGDYIMNPFEAVPTALSEEYRPTFFSVFNKFNVIFIVAMFIGISKAVPKHEFEDTEHGSSDWCTNGEQYRVLHRKKGIVLAEKNYLPVDKRGNVNVLVVRRFWCW